ncbi:rab-GTPase-TBC domain-containing protein [Cokeromyces recurvatus]|uniref:rab-GTPase-TBC domain-containing protein n=1 Tax=Cokeromyces recurvatus TaxID=90255 RepID=UPI00221FB738|nr:rab-GTPase-TBC domain-containing protein [Cokeromyces recurvatus]KAI7897609.1 rab-GTPase-TBC domain-containing protein [Cokeromyces recurvatus]
MSNVLETKRKAWDVIFNDPNLSLNSLRHRAIAGTVCQSGLRSVCWKIFLGYLPTLEVSTWSSLQLKERQEYGDLKRKYIEEPTKKMKNSEKNEDDLSDNNPLALNDSNPWQQYFIDAEIRKVIQQDVERTFPDIDFFRDNQVQQSLTDILFIYCKLNEDVSYRQGMHELLAPLYWVLALESIDQSKLDYDSSDPATKLMVQVLNSNFIEHDAYILFNKLMKYGKSWYEFNDDILNKKKNISTNNKIKSDLLSMANNDIPKPTESARLNPIVMTCYRIHHHYLRTVDPLLYQHLENFGIEPQLYGLRWIRLLFGREFDIYELLKLWDAIFAQDPTLQIVEYICLVILLHMRDLLLQKDYAECLSLLMRPPPISKPASLVEQAKYLQENLSTDTALHILQQNDVRSGKEPRKSMSNDIFTDSMRQHPPLSHKGSQGFESFSRLTNNVMKNPQVRDLNRAIAGVMGTVQKNVNTFGENILGSSRPQDGLGPRHSTVSSEFPSTIERIITTHKSEQSSSLQKPLSSLKHNTPTQQQSSINHQMGEMMATCIRLLENELFPSSEKEEMTLKKEESKMENGTDDDNEEGDDITPSDKNNHANTHQKISFEESPNDMTIITALAGLKHIRDVLLGKQTQLDSSVISQFEKNESSSPPSDEWDLVDRTEIAALPPPKLNNRSFTSPSLLTEDNEKSKPLQFTPYVPTTPTPPKQHIKYRIEDLLSDPDLQLPNLKRATSTQKFKWVSNNHSDNNTNIHSDHLFNEADKGLLLGTTKPSSRRRTSFIHTSSKKPVSFQEQPKSYESAIDPLDAKNVDNKKVYEYDLS